MCGIVGYIGKSKCVPKIIKGLENLEYRGYDSAGIAYKEKNNVVIIKEQGRIDNLKKILKDNNSNIGIGHTRWATHGKPCKINSHPHKINNITLVHNGIIENYKELKNDLKEYDFISETDTEIVAALIDKLYKEQKDMLKVLNLLKDHLIGSYALGIILDEENKIYTIRKDSPLIIGINKDGNYIASDVPAILEYTNKYYLLDNNEYGVLENNKITIYNNGKIIEKELKTFDYDIESAMKNGYDHFMLKEIYEQPTVLKNTVNEYLFDIDSKLKGLEKYDSIDIVGCGSAYHVGLIGKYLITKYGKVNVSVDVASEYRYTEQVYTRKHLIILISQSGETADTLAVLRLAKEKNIDTLAIVNVVGSSIAREANKVLYIKAGPEIAVATTKAYSCQLIMISIIAYYLGLKNNLGKKSLLKEFSNIDKEIENIFKDLNQVKRIANKIYKQEHLFYLGRKIDYATSLEASLKLKEISYIHSEAYAAGELKHGTISLITDNTPVISIVTDDTIKLKTLSNIKEVCSRGALSIIITNDKYIDKDLYNELILIPKLSEFNQSLLVIVYCQLIAYYVAVLKGCDIDKPRNLAKSVTVE